MTVKWIDTEVEAGKLGNPANISPGIAFAFAATFEVAAADEDGDIYKIASLDASLIPLDILINNDAITAGDDWDLGLYTNEDVAKDADIFVDGADLSSGHAMGAELSGLTALPIASIGAKKIYELAGDTISTKRENYILALTANTVGTAAGTISIRGQFIQG